MGSHIDTVLLQMTDEGASYLIVLCLQLRVVDIPDAVIVDVVTETHDERHFVVDHGARKLARDVALHFRPRAEVSNAGFRGGIA